MFSIQVRLRNWKAVQIVLRWLRYNLWRRTGITNVSYELPALEQIIKRSAPEDLVAQSGGKRILMFTYRLWNIHVIWDVLLGQALRMRGADVRFFTCGGPLPICDISAHTLAPPPTMRCDSCAPYITKVLSLLGFPFHVHREFISPAEKAEIRSLVSALSPDEYERFELDGIPIGQLVLPSVQWYLLSGSLPPDPAAQAVYRRFLISGAIMSRVSGRLLDNIQPEIVYLLNGIFFAERIMIEHAQRRGIPFITHEAGFSEGAQVFARNDFAPYYPTDKAWPTYAQRPLSPSEAERLDTYLNKRICGKSDINTYYPSMETDAEAIIGQLGLDRSKLIVSLYTNVGWDTSCFAPGGVFSGMDEWIAHTIRHFAARNDAQLIIRVHPAEVRLEFHEPRETAIDIIQRLFPQLPSHIHIISPESSISSYTLMDISQLNLVYTSTTGMEAILRGCPLIVAGQAFYSGKGFTREIGSVVEYDRLLGQPSSLEPPTAEQIELVRRYACMFFFRHHLPFPLASSEFKPVHKVHLNFQTMAALRPGRNQYIDLLCDAILYDRPFLYTGAL